MLLPVWQNCLFWKKQTASGQSNNMEAIELAHGGMCRRIRIGGLSRWVSKTGATLSNQVIQVKAQLQSHKISCLQTTPAKSVTVPFPVATITAHILAIAMN